MIQVLLQYTTNYISFYRVQAKSYISHHNIKQVKSMIPVDENSEVRIKCFCDLKHTNDMYNVRIVYNKLTLGHCQIIDWR